MNKFWIKQNKNLRNNCQEKNLVEMNGKVEKENTCQKAKEKINHLKINGKKI